MATCIARVNHGAPLCLSGCKRRARCKYVRRSVRGVHGGVSPKTAYGSSSCDIFWMFFFGGVGSLACACRARFKKHRNHQGTLYFSHNIHDARHTRQYPSQKTKNGQPTQQPSNALPARQRHANLAYESHHSDHVPAQHNRAPQHNVPLPSHVAQARVIEPHADAHPTRTGHALCLF